MEENNIAYSAYNVVRIYFNYLCTSKYNGHVYDFFRRANPLQGG